MNISNLHDINGILDITFLSVFNFHNRLHYFHINHMQCVIRMYDIIQKQVTTLRTDDRVISKKKRKRKRLRDLFLTLVI